MSKHATQLKKSSFGDKLRELRRQHGFSQDILAEKIGIHGRHVGKLETENILPNADTAINIARLFNVSIDYLLLDEEEQTAPSRIIADKELLENFSQVAKMDEKQKNIIKELLQAFIAKQQIKDIMTKL